MKPSFGQLDLLQDISVVYASMSSNTLIFNELCQVGRQARKKINGNLEQHSK